MMLPLFRSCYALLCLAAAVPLLAQDPYGLCHRVEGQASLNSALPPTVTGPLPSTLSATGAYRDLATLKLHESFVPYTVNSPLWSDGAEKSRYFMIPGTGATNAQRITWSPTGDWSFPDGSVFVKHFELVTNEVTGAKQRLETRFIVRKPGGGIYGVTYRWNAAQTDATLVADAGESEVIFVRKRDGLTTQTWHYPSRSACLQCHNATTSGVLGVNTRQLNGDFYYPGLKRTDHQLRTLAAMGYFTTATTPSAAQIAAASALAPLDRVTVSTEHRVRSYLDSNCSHCHRPGGITTFDGRFDTPFSAQNLVNTANCVVGQPFTSRVHVRSALPSTLGGMPPLAKELVDQSWMDVLREWIGTSFNPIQVSTKGQLNKVTVRFNQPIGGGSLFSGGVFQIPGRTLFSPIIQADGRSVELTVTPPLVANTSYSLTCTGINGALPPAETCWPGVRLDFTAEAVPNDQFATPTALPSAAVFQWGLTNVTATTTEPGEPDHGSPTMNRSVWFTWTAPYTGFFALDTFASDYDTAIAVYTGSALNALTVVGKSPYDTYAGRNRARFYATAGTVYRIAVAAEIYHGILQLGLQMCPDNDYFGHAKPLPPGRTELQMHDFLTGSDEPGFIGIPGSNTAWYSWQAPEDLAAEITVTHPSKDMAVFAYTLPPVQVFSLSDLILVASNDDDPVFGPTPNSRLEFQAVAKQRYWIAIVRKPSASESRDLTTITLTASLPPTVEWINPIAGGRVSTTSTNYLAVRTKNRDIWVDGVAYYDGNDFIGSATNFSPLVTWSPTVAGPHTLRAVIVDIRGRQWSHALPVIASPGAVNDNPVSARVLTGLSLTTTGTNTDATASADEPSHSCSHAGHSVWFRWIAPATMRVKLSTQGSDFDTTLDVYQADGRTPVTAGLGTDDSRDLTSRASFNATAGQAFTIAVDGWNGATGNYTLSLSQDNDDFNQALALVSAQAGSQFTADITTNNADATGQPNEPSHGGTGPVFAANNSLWFSWVAETAALTTVSTAGSNFDTTLSIYRGTELHTLSLVAFNDDTPPYNTSEATFYPTPGTRYWIAVDGYGSATGTVKLRVSQGGGLDILSVTPQANGSLQLTVQGLVEELLVLDSSPDLITWTPIDSQSVAGNGLAVFIDPTGTVARRYYRVHRPL
jgi:hypothetical protein